jgi:hypothetical protein
MPIAIIYIEASQISTNIIFQSFLTLPLLFSYKTLYNIYVSNMTMAINVIWNRRSGPGGGTRRLHHKRSRKRPFLWGRNRIDTRNKGIIFAR